MVVSAFMLGFNLNVKAEDVVFNSKEIPGLKAYDYLGDSSTSNITVRYDDKLKVSVVDITTNGLNDEAIEAILNHKAGNANSPAVFGTLYFGIDTSIAGSNFKKCSEPFNGVENMASAKSAVDSQIGSESPLTNNSVWVPQIKIDYYDNNQSKFVPLNDGGATGNKTVRDAIDDKFSDKSFSQLVYGTDYVFYGYEDRSYVGVFTSDADSYSEKYYLLVNVHTTFPVESETVETGDKGNFNKEGYFPSLKEAMIAQNYSKNININGNVTIDEDLEVPAGVTLNAQNGSLTVKAGHTLTIKGNVKIDPQDITLEEGANIDLTTGKLENLEGDALHVVEVSTVQNGTITTNPVYAAAGDTVKIMASPNAGYKLDTESLKVTNKSTEDTIEITNNTFIMPDSDVTVSGQFIVDEDLNSLYNFSYKR